MNASNDDEDNEGGELKLPLRPFSSSSCSGDGLLHEDFDELGLLSCMSTSSSSYSIFHSLEKVIDDERMIDDFWCPQPTSMGQQFEEYIGESRQDEQSEESPTPDSTLLLVQSAHCSNGESNKKDHNESFPCCSVPAAYPSR
jgi:hypothetical protein